MPRSRKKTVEELHKRAKVRNFPRLLCLNRIKVHLKVGGVNE